MQALNPDRDIEVPYEALLLACKLYIDGEDWERVGMRRKLCDGTPRIPPTQTKPPMLVLFLSSHDTAYSLYNRCRKRVSEAWSDIWRSRFNAADPKVLSNLGCGIFDVRPFGKGEASCCYYGSLVYFDLRTWMVTTEYYEEWMLNMFVPEFRKWIN